MGNVRGLCINTAIAVVCRISLDYIISAKHETSSGNVRYAILFSSTVPIVIFSIWDSCSIHNILC